MSSTLSANVTNANYYNQAARNVACMAEALRLASAPPSDFESVGFFVIAPEARIDEGVFSEYMGKDSIREIVQRRVAEFEDAEKDQWFEEWFLPTLATADIRCISWEELLDVIENHDPAEGAELREFYANCLKFNRPASKR